MPFQPLAYIVDLDLSRVALVNAGANSRANILLTKRREPTDMPKTLEQIMGEFTPEVTAVLKAAQDAAVAAAVATITTEKEAIIGTLTSELEVAKSATKEVPAQDAGNLEILLKSVDPKLAGYVEDLQKSVKALQANEAENLAKSRYEAVKALPMEEPELKDILKSASPAVYEVLVKAAKAIEAKVIKNPEGVAGEGAGFGTDSNAAYSILEKSAKAIQVSKNCTFEAAFTDACTQDPIAYNNYVKGDK